MALVHFLISTTRPGGSGSHGPRVIYHVPLRDQEQASERLSRKGWRQGHTDREGNWKGPFKENSQVCFAVISNYILYIT